MTQEKTQTVYFFKNTCPYCYNDIEYPLLGDFSYGELIFQTHDAQEFAIAILIDNDTFKFIQDYLKHLETKEVDAQFILAKVADPMNGQELTNDILCNICRRKQRHFFDNVRKRVQEISFVKWANFESLTQENKRQLLSEIIAGEI